jgi:hypothetical protein
MRRLMFLVFLSIMLVFAISIASAQRAENLDLSFFLGMKDGSEPSEGVIVSFIVEEPDGDTTTVFEEHWVEQEWSDEFVVPLNEWGGETITLNLTTDPGITRNTGWDWILIGDAKITADDDLVFDIGQAVASGTQEVSILVDGQDEEEKGLGFGANCQLDGGTVGGETKPKSFMQHPPWDGAVGNAISRYEIELPFAVGAQAVHATGKLATTWASIRKREL